MSHQDINSSFSPRTTLLASVLVASVALLATALMVGNAASTSRVRQRDLLNFEAELAADQLRHQVEHIEAVMDSAGAVFDASSGVNLDRWRPLLTGLMKTESSTLIKRIGVILPRQGRTRASRGETALVARYVEPDAGSVWAVGFDGGLPDRISRHLQDSARTGASRMARIEDIVTDEAISVVVRPLFLEPGGDSGPVRGWVFAVLEVAELSPSVLDSEHSSACAIDLSQGGRCVSDLDHPGPCPVLQPDATASAYRDFNVFGHRWRVVVSPRRAAGVGTLAMSIIGSGGLILAFLLGSLTWMFLRAQARAQDLAALMSELQRARDSADAANRAKGDFLANMSHEIRTPMTAVLGFAEMISRDEVTQDERQQCVETIRRNGDHLVAIINDILDISKIESGRYEIDRRLCAPADVLRDVVELMRGRAVERNLEFTVQLAAGLPEKITTDPVRLRQILVNLVGNAIKFTAAGRVAVLARPATRSESEAHAICIEVSDTGEGVTDAQIERIFDPFVQADESVTRRHGGAGLGLVISRRLARMLGGDIHVQSEPGRGSTFSVTVATGDVAGTPLASSARLDPQCKRESSDQVRRESSAESLSPLRGVRALLAEDGPDNQRLLTFMLEKAGAQVVVASNGEEAIRIYERAAARGFDLILMDMQMPVLDGYTATRTLRNRACETPILALTAHAMAGDRDKCLGAGCTDYLTKPINRQTLIARCASLIANAA